MRRPVRLMRSQRRSSSHFPRRARATTILTQGEVDKSNRQVADDLFGKVMRQTQRFVFGVEIGIPVKGWRAQAYDVRSLAWRRCPPGRYISPVWR